MVMIGIAAGDDAGKGVVTRSIECDVVDDSVTWLFHAKGVAIMVLLCGAVDASIRGIFSGVSTQPSLYDLSLAFISIPAG